MAEERRELTDRLRSIFDLPGDILLDVARITLVGNAQLAIENHRGLIEYGPDKVVVGVPRGQLAVTGEGLTIGRITAEEVILSGRVAGLQFTD